MRKRTPKPKSQAIDNVHRAVCIITLLAVVGLFIYIITLSNAISDAIVRREKDFIEMKDRVRNTETTIIELNRVAGIRQETIAALNADVILLKGQLDVIDTKLLGKPTTQPPTTQPTQ